MMSFEGAFFRRQELPDVLLALCRRMRWRVDESGLAHEGQPTAAATESWFPRLAESLDLRARPVRLNHGELPSFLAGRGPALLRPIADPDGILPMVRQGPRGCRLLSGRRVTTEEIHQELTRDSRSEMESRGPSLELADLPQDQVEIVHRALATEWLKDEPAASGWVIEQAPSAPLLWQLRSAGVLRSLGLVGLAHLASALLVVASWWTIGSGALDGELDRGWLLAWALLLLTTLPLRMTEVAHGGLAAWWTGAVLKRRLLEGALRLERDEVRGQGAGEVLARVIDSERVESLATNGGLLSILPVIELVLAAAVLSAGAVPAMHLGLLGAWLLVLFVVATAFLRRRFSWTRVRLDMTHRLVERLFGHRTRLAQEPRAAWHETEDRELEDYARASSELDRWPPLLQVLIPRLWLITSLAALLPPAFAGTLDATGLAVSLGGSLMAFGALRSLVSVASEIGGAAISAHHVTPIFKAARQSKSLGSASAEDEAAIGSTSLLEAERLRFRYPTRFREAIRDGTLTIRPGDRVLLEGSSGSGKSSLAALLAGLREPQQGWLGLHGLDLAVWGEEAWRHRVAYVPQFHDNHLLTAPLAFNLLMGRRWPATPEDLQEAKRICEELGLGPLLEQMPAGLMQPVGDSGWQLSQGEKVRVFLARALLQDAELLILDETFSGLDFENLGRSIECAASRSAALLVIAHP